MKKITILTFSLLMLAGISKAQWSFNGIHIYSSNTGNIGIGTATPAARLDIAGGNNWNLVGGEWQGGIMCLN